MKPDALSPKEAADLAKTLPGALEREHRLLPALKRLGVSDDELKVLEGDEHLLRILAEESERASTEDSRRELKRVLSWHAARLQRVAAEATQPKR